MTLLIRYSLAVLLGAIDGFLFGSICYIADRIDFEFQVRQVAAIEARSGNIIDLIYLTKWWMFPLRFLLLFTIVSALLHWLHHRRVSALRLWQEIGLLSVAIAVVLMSIFGLFNDWVFNSDLFATYLFLFVTVVILNLFFAAVLHVAQLHRRLVVAL